MKVSVYIPTYKRLAFLKRAVADVMAQTYKDWELIISDNEIGEDKETWKFLVALARQDSRVHVFKNPGEVHDQAHNVNNALSHCTGEWVKPFYDDDRMAPECLGKMVGALERIHAAGYEESRIAMVGCRAQKWRGGVYAGDEENFTRGDIDIIRSADARLAICKFDRWNGRTPQHMLIRRSVIENGVWMPTDLQYSIPIDVVWFANILDCGDYAMLNSVLVHQCEGEVASLTGEMRRREADLDKELLLAYKDIYDAIPLERRRGLAWRDICAEINGVRGLYHLKCHRTGQAIRMFLKMFLSLKGTFLVLRWLLQVSFYPGFSASKRISIGHKNKRR